MLPISKGQFRVRMRRLAEFCPFARNLTKWGGDEDPNPIKPNKPRDHLQTQNFPINLRQDELNDHSMRGRGV